MFLHLSHDEGDFGVTLMISLRTLLFILVLHVLCLVLVFSPRNVSSCGWPRVIFRTHPDVTGKEKKSYLFYPKIVDRIYSFHLLIELSFLEMDVAHVVWRQGGLCSVSVTVSSRSSWWTQLVGRSLSPLTSELNLLPVTDIRLQNRLTPSE